MRLAGLFLVVLGIGGLAATQAIVMTHDTASVVTGGSWTAVVIGGLLVLSALARTLGLGVFPLAFGLAAVIDQETTRWTMSGAAHAWQSWIVAGAVAMIVLGMIAIFVVLAAEETETVVRVLGLFMLGSASLDLSFDFGSGWDALVNLSTAALAVGFGVALVFLLTEGLNDEPGIPEALAFLTRFDAVGLGFAAMLITVMSSFDLATGVDLALTAVAVLGVWVSAPSVALIMISEVYEFEPEDVGELLEDAELVGRLVRVWISGFVMVALLVEVIVFQPGSLLTAAAIVLALMTGALGVMLGISAYREISAFLVEAEEHPRRRPHFVAENLERLADRSAVYRLLPLKPQKAPVRFDV